MSHVNFVLVVSESHFELQGVVISACFLFHLVFEVGNILSVAVPANVSLSSFIHWVKKRFLTLVVGTIRLHKVYYLKFVSNVFTHVWYLEVEPLRIRCCLVVVLQNQVVRVRLCHFNCSSKISPLKSTLKQQRAIVCRLFLVERLQLLVVSVHFATSN